MEPRATIPGPGTVVDARGNPAIWLRAGRSRRKLSLEDVARITKIQTRILEKLEAGRIDGLPAEVFVRGFVRSFARCVGLDEAEAIERLGHCQPATNPVAPALVETMAREIDDVDPAAIAVTETVAVAEPVALTAIET